VLNGLSEGEEVVTYGNFAIDAAAQLNNQASMMNKDVNRSTEEEQPTPDFRAENPDAFKTQLSELTDAYIQLKDAFVATQTKEAGQAAREVLSRLEKVDMNLLEGEAHRYWMEKRNALRAHTQKITESADIEAQRKQFEFLSNTLIETLSAFGSSQDSLFIQHCPMAFNDEGADWIAREKQIRNPYFGDKMLRCGIVKGSLAGK
jgi:Cu(I)/Ag(I) efflux system membrane fusion protein